MAHGEKEQKLALDNYSDEDFGDIGGMLDDNNNKDGKKYGLSEHEVPGSRCIRSSDTREDAIQGIPAEQGQ